MPDIAYIKELKNYYVTELYAKTRTEQKIDQEYRDDTFAVPEVREPHKPLRLGIGSRMVDAPAEQIITSNPQVYFMGDNEKVVACLSKVVNGKWIPYLKNLNPNPFKELVKDKLCRGESYIRVAQNPAWHDGDKVGLPFLFVVPDPMTIYSSIEDNDGGWLPGCGVPNNTIVYSNRLPSDVLLRYPDWEDKKQRKSKKERVEWIEYHTKDYRCFIADDEVVLEGENPYGFNPHIRKFSGFGRRSPDGELADLIVSDLRFSRDLIKEHCIIESDIAYRSHLAAHRPLIVTSEGEIDEKQLQNVSLGAYDISALGNLPPNTVLQTEINIPPPTQAEYQYASMKWSELVQRNPFLMSGFPQGSSGRQQDMSTTAAGKRYDAPIENTQLGVATAIEMALAICAKIPDLLPEGLSREDIERKYSCEVKLRADDPIERDRAITLMDRLRTTGGASLRSFLIQGRGMTQDEADDEIAQILAEKVTIYNPDVAAVLGMDAAMEMGMADKVLQAKQKTATMQQNLGASVVQGGQGGVDNPMTPSAMQRAQGEAQTTLGMEQSPEPVKGARTPPVNYTRGD